MHSQKRVLKIGEKKKKEEEAEREEGRERGEEGERLMNKD